MRRRINLGLIAAFVLASGLQGSSQPAPPPGFVGSYVWRSDDPRFGGVSAIEITDGGRGFVALSDRGAFAKGRLQRIKGRITGITSGKFTLLKGHDDSPLASGCGDSEGLALAADGSAFVSFEGAARVLHYNKISGQATNLPEHPDFARQKANAAFEALAIDSEGTLYTLPERSTPQGRTIPVYRFQDGKWDQRLSVPRFNSYAPVAADIGPDGRFYLLERQFNGFSGFSSRLRRFTIGGKLSHEEVLLQTATGQHDNLEGLSVWRDAEGILRATMVSDDNFNLLQVTELVEYQLPD